MKCRYCQKKVETELVEHIILVHPSLILYNVVARMDQESKFQMLLDVFPDFKNILEG